MILVYKGEVYYTSQAAREAAGYSRKEIDSIVDELWMDGGCEASWRLFKDEASDDELTQARLATIDEAVFLLQSEKTSREKTMAYHQSRIHFESSKWDETVEELAQLQEERLAIK